MNMQELKETVDGLAKASGIRRCRHVLRRNNDSVLRAALNFELSCQRKRGRTKKIWKKQVKEERENISLKTDDALYQAMWQDAARRIAEGMR